MIRGAGSQGIQAREKMADVPIAIDKGFNPGLQENPIRITSHPLGLIRRAFCGKFKTLKEKLPIPGNCKRILFPQLVLRIDIVGIQESGKIHQDGSTSVMYQKFCARFW